jgi:hypothetical protein
LEAEESSDAAGGDVLIFYPLSCRDGPNVGG